MILLDYPIKCFNWTMTMRLSNYLLAVIVRNAKSGMVSATQKSPLLSGKAAPSPGKAKKIYCKLCCLEYWGNTKCYKDLLSLAGINPHQHHTDQSADS